MSNCRSQSNRCKLLMNLASKSNENKDNTDQNNINILHGIVSKFENNNMYNNNSIMENVDNIIVSLGNNF